MSRQYSVEGDFVSMLSQTGQPPSPDSERPPSPPRHSSLSEEPTENVCTLKRKSPIRSKSETSLIFISDESDKTPRKGSSIKMPASYFNNKPDGRSPAISNASTSSSTSSRPPPSYESLESLPKQFINGHLELASSDARNPSRYLTWDKHYIEVSDGDMKLRGLRELSCWDTTLELSKYFVAIQNKRQIRLDSSNDHRTFRAPNECQALKWMLVLTPFSRTLPSAEGFTKKLGGKNRDTLQLRYLRLSEEGLLSWYKGETIAEPRGTIQIRGEDVDQDNNKPEVILIHTAATSQAEKRRYWLNFMSAEEASRWFHVLSWHAKRNPLEHTSMAIRNPRN